MFRLHSLCFVPRDFKDVSSRAAHTLGICQLLLCIEFFVKQHGIVFAALMEGKGRVLAFDKDPKRLKQLKANAAATGADCITARVADFLQLPLATSPEFRHTFLASISASPSASFTMSLEVPLWNHWVGDEMVEILTIITYVLVSTREMLLCRNVRGALVDPSCSGSGTTLSRMDFLLPSHAAQHSPASAEEPTAEPTSAGRDSDVIKQPSCSRIEHEGGSTSGQIGRGGSAAAPGEQPETAENPKRDAAEEGSNGKRSEGDRIERLARFQEAVVLHALTLPALQRLVYSTCSVHERENEAVVAAVLPRARELGFELAAPFPGWPRRGLASSVEGAERLVRTHAVEDGTDGFFLAVFQRKAES